MCLEAVFTAADSGVRVKSPLYSSFKKCCLVIETAHCEMDLDSIHISTGPTNSIYFLIIRSQLYCND